MYRTLWQRTSRGWDIQGSLLASTPRSSNSKHARRTKPETCSPYHVRTIFAEEFFGPVAGRTLS